MLDNKTDKSLPNLFSDLTRETIDLMRQEAALARAEIAEKVDQAQSAVGSMAVGAAIAMAGLVILLLAATTGLAMVLPPDLAPWLAPLIVGLVATLIGYALMQSGRSGLKAGKLVPRKTIDSLSRDKALVQEKL